MMMYCGSCGAKLLDGAKFCPSCGARTDEPDAQAAGLNEQTPDGVQQPVQEPAYSAPIQPPEQEPSYSAPVQPPVQEPSYYTPAQPPVQQSAQEPSYYTPAQPPVQQSAQEPAYYTPAQPPAQQSAQEPSYYTPAQPPAQYQQPQQPPAQYQQQGVYQPSPEKKKLSKQMKILFITLPVVVVLAAGGFLLHHFLSTKPDDVKEPAVIEETAPSPSETVSQIVPEDSTDSPEPEKDVELPYVTYSFLDKKPEAVIEFTAVDSIFPSNYRTLDSLVVFTGYSDYGELDVLIEVEVPGFTQQFKQKVTLGRQVTKLRIIPPLVTGTIDLNSEKMAQLVYSVTDNETGRILVQESKNLKIYSKFDMVWGNANDFYSYIDNILAWMTPDAPEILELKRDAIDYLSFITEGALNALIGYQDYNFFEHHYSNTWVQAVAIQGAMSDITEIRYNNSLFSMDAEQRVKLPADTLTSRSGLCIETALVMASALESTGMHVMLIFPPGHAQVAVEASPYSGDYFLIETTILPMTRDMETWNNTVLFLSQDEWLGYITGEGYYTYGPCYVLDCDLGEKLGIRAMSN